jgi:predicted DNA-binding WGR domain protein
VAKNRRRFEFEQGKSRKFWEVSVDGTALTVSFGRMGTNGQVKVKRLASPEAARMAAEKLVRQKIDKGYVEESSHPRRQPSSMGEKPARSSRGNRSRPSGKTSPKKGKRSSRKLPWGPGNPRFEALVERFTQSQERAAAHAREERKRDGKLPTKLERRLDWDGFEAEVRKTRPKKRVSVKLKRIIPGLSAPPPSYVEFVSRFADTYEWLIVYRKRGWPRGFNLLGKRIAKERAFLNEAFKADAPRKASRVRDLVPFATDASQTFFCFDSANVDRRDEPPIYAVDHNLPYGIRHLGNDLLEVIQHYRP